MAASYKPRKSAWRTTWPTRGELGLMTVSQSCRAHCLTRRDLVASVGRRYQPGDFLQIDDRADDSREDHPVVGLNDLVGSNRPDDLSVTLDLDQK